MVLRCTALTVDDLPALLDIEQHAHHHPWNRALFEQSFAPLYHNFAIRDAHQLVGYAFTRCIADEGELQNICIDLAHQNQGAGRQLLTYLMNELAQRGLRQLFLEVRVSNQAAIHLYRRCGWCCDGIRRDYYPNGSSREDACLMSASLSAAI